MENNKYCLRRVLVHQAPLSEPAMRRLLTNDYIALRVWLSRILADHRLPAAAFQVTGDRLLSGFKSMPAQWFSRSMPRDANCAS